MSNLNLYAKRTGYTFTLDEPLHVAQTAFKPTTYRLISEVVVTITEWADGTVSTDASAKGRAATKAGALRGTYKEVVYGDEAALLEVQALRMVEAMINANLPAD
jgi:hypothetical protein